MRRMMILMTLILLTAACDQQVQALQKTGKEEAGEVAITCIDQMSKCDDWEPVTMGDGAKVVPLEDCGEEYDYECNVRNEMREDRNWKVMSRPKTRSPCQQKLDACVQMVEALVGTPTQVHNHYEKR